MHTEPAYSEIFLTRCAFVIYGKKVYKSFSDRLPLEGAKEVLDFGCGMGTVAYYTLKRLESGRLTCLDISERWLKACRKTLRDFPDVSFINDRAALENDCFDIIYCHFVLHDIQESELEEAIPDLVRALKCGGVLVFREPLNEVQKLVTIKRLLSENGLILKDSRITDVPLMGNSLESVYMKAEPAD